MEKDSNPVFHRDELNLLEVNPAWDAETILSQQGMFFLKDIAKELDLEPIKVKVHAAALEKAGHSPWTAMGVRKIWNHWMVRMKVFAPYYREHLINRVKKIPPEWDGNQLIHQKGVYFLTDVCRVIPFTSHQLRYQAKRHPKAREELGIWKDPDVNAFVVDMELFGPWISRLWRSGRVSLAQLGS